MYLEFQSQLHSLEQYSASALALVYVWLTQQLFQPTTTVATTGDTPVDKKRGHLDTRYMFDLLIT